VQSVQSVPEELVQLWEDFYFMRLCDYAWSGRVPEDRDITVAEPHQGSQDLRSIFSQPSPHLIKILQAYTLARHHSTFLKGDLSLFHIRLWVDLSWHEMRTALCPLRAITGEDGGRLRDVLDLVTDPTVYQHFSSILQEVQIVWRCLHLLKRIEAQELPWQYRQV
jgi:hypothetical protein